MSTPTDRLAVPPPWIACPELQPDDPVNQGLAASYIELTWLPMWLDLTTVERDAYLAAWTATPAWRAAIRDRYDTTTDYKAEAETFANSERARASDAARPGLFKWFHR